MILHGLAFKKIQKMGHIAVGGRLFTIDANGLGFVKVGNIQNFRIGGMCGPGVLSGQVESDTCLRKFSKAGQIVAEHRKIGSEARFFADTQQHPV